MEGKTARVRYFEEFDVVGSIKIAMMKEICGKRFRIVYFRAEKATERGEYSCFDVRGDDKLVLMVPIDEMSRRNPNDSFHGSAGDGGK